MDFPSESIATEVTVVWEILTAADRVYATSSKPTAEAALAEAEETLRGFIEMRERVERDYGPLDTDFRAVTFTGVRRRTTIQVTAYSTTYSDEMDVAEISSTSTSHIVTRG